MAFVDALEKIGRGHATTVASSNTLAVGPVKEGDTMRVVLRIGEDVARVVGARGGAYVRLLVDPERRLARLLFSDERTASSRKLSGRRTLYARFRADLPLTIAVPNEMIEIDSWQRVGKEQAIEFSLGRLRLVKEADTALSPANNGEWFRRSTSA